MLEQARPANPSLLRPDSRGLPSTSFKPHSSPCQSSARLYYNRRANRRRTLKSRKTPAKAAFSAPTPPHRPAPPHSPKREAAFAPLPSQVADLRDISIKAWLLLDFQRIQGRCERRFTCIPDNRIQGFASRWLFASRFPGLPHNRFECIVRGIP